MISIDTSANALPEPSSSLRLELPSDCDNDIDVIIQQYHILERPSSPIPDHILERPSSPITVMFDQNDDLEANVDVDVDGDGDGDGDGDVDHTDEATSLLGSTKIDITDSIKKELLEEFATMWSNSANPLSKSILVKILVRAMEIVEKTDIKGHDQQDIVINILVEILESDLVVSLHKEVMLTFLKEDAGDVISIVVDASKGKININKLQGIVVRLFKKIGGCFA
tara:strand:- start:576 stop:1250 length:675 start_codon:yes stop_codon:yes gene_type:complete